MKNNEHQSTHYSANLGHRILYCTWSPEFRHSPEFRACLPSHTWSPCMYLCLNRLYCCFRRFWEFLCQIILGVLFFIQFAFFYLIFSQGSSCLLSSSLFNSIAYVLCSSCMIITYILSSLFGWTFGLLL